MTIHNSAPKADLPLDIVLPDLSHIDISVKPEDTARGSGAAVAAVAPDPNYQEYRETLVDTGCITRVADNVLGHSVALGHAKLRLQVWQSKYSDFDKLDVAEVLEAVAAFPHEALHLVLSAAQA